MALPAFILAAGKGIAAGVKAVWVWTKANAAIVATGATIGATALSGNVFEGKKKKISFGRSESMNVGKYSFRVPQLKVQNLRNGERASTNANKSYKRKYSK